MTGRHACRTKSTELPDSVLEAILAQVAGQDIRAGCRLATTCKPLWTAQLPSSVHRHDIVDSIGDEDEPTAMRFIVREGTFCCMRSVDISTTDWTIRRTTVLHEWSVLYAGIAWTLQRVEAATQLSFKTDDYPFYSAAHNGFPEIGEGPDFDSIKAGMQAAIRASRTFPCLKALVCLPPLQSQRSGTTLVMQRHSCEHR